MSIHLIDSNVVSELWKPVPNPNVLAWFVQARWRLPVPVIAEIQTGAEAAGSEARRKEVNDRLDFFLERNPDAALDWDAETSRVWGRLKHSKEVRRQPQALWDSLIDAMAVRFGCLVATRNTADFRHADTFDPWTFSEHPAAE